MNNHLPNMVAQQLIEEKDYKKRLEKHAFFRRFYGEDAMFLVDDIISASFADQIENSEMLKCDCGGDKAGTPHSTWCQVR